MASKTSVVFSSMSLLALGAHEQLGLRSLVRECVRLICPSVSYHDFPRLRATSNGRLPPRRAAVFTYAHAQWAECACSHF